MPARGLDQDRITPIILAKNEKYEQFIKNKDLFCILILTHRTTNVTIYQINTIGKYYMYAQTLTSVLTLGFSMTSVGLLSRFRSLLKHSLIISRLDQMVRAVMLSFAIFHIGSELLETFSATTLIMLTSGFFIIQQLIATTYKNSNHEYIQEKYPWLIYTLLIPHFITEGLTIAPQASSNPLSIIIAGFLLHKTFEVAMLTMTTNSQIHCKVQRRVLQTLFIILTPLSILLYGQYQDLIAIDETLMGYTEFLNFIVFIQLSTFCQFCTHSQDKESSWVQTNKCFILSFAAISIAVYFYPGILIS